MTKAELRSYKDLKREKDELERLIQEFLESTSTMKAVKLTEVASKHGAKASNPMLSALIMQEEIAGIYAAKVQRLAAAILRIEKAISDLPPVERRIIRLYYIEGLKWQEVCTRMVYSWQRVHQIHGKALATLSKKE